MVSFVVSVTSRQIELRLGVRLVRPREAAKKGGLLMTLGVFCIAGVRTEGLIVGDFVEGVRATIVEKSG